MRLLNTTLLNISTNRSMCHKHKNKKFCAQRLNIAHYGQITNYINEAERWMKDNVKMFIISCSAALILSISYVAALTHF